MGSPGLLRLLKVSYLTTAGQWHGMAQNGSLEEMEQINLRIHLTGSLGLHPILEMGCLRMVIA
jgi:hypothetical protein